MVQCPNLHWDYWAVLFVGIIGLLYMFNIFYLRTAHLRWIWNHLPIKSGLPLNVWVYSSELKYLLNPMVIKMIAVWYHVKERGAFYPFSCFSPIWGNTKFKPGFKIWADKGIENIADIYVNSVIWGNTVFNTYNIPTNHLFKYLQIRNCILKSQNKSLAMPSLSIWKGKWQGIVLVKV